MASTRIPLIAGNWKLNLDHHEAVHLVQKLAWALKDGKHDYSATEVVVLPSFTAIRSVQTLVDADKLEIGYGAQDVSSHANGAYTGEVSAAQLAKLGVSYVAVGHSERREYHQESDALVAAKAVAAFGAGIVPIVCVGEGLAVRKAGEQDEMNAVPPRLEEKSFESWNIIGREGLDFNRGIDAARIGKMREPITDPVPHALPPQLKPSTNSAGSAARSLPAFS